MITDKLKPEDYINLIDYAVLQFKLSLAFLTKREYLGQFTWGQHTLESQDLELSPEEEELASSLFEHSATYILAIQVDSAFENLLPDRFNYSDIEIKSACVIARLIRNSFAHSPLAPIWLVPKAMRNQIFEVKNTIKLATTNLNNQPISRWDYGGPIALLKLANFSLRVIKSDF